MEVLRAAAASIHRLGSREGLVHVVRSVVARVGEVEGGETLMYAPVEAVEERPEGSIELSVWDPRAPEAYTPPRGRGPVVAKPLRLVAPAAMAVGGGVLVPGPEEVMPARLRRGYPAYPIPPGLGVEGVVAALPR